MHTLICGKSEGRKAFRNRNLWVGYYKNESLENRKYIVDRIYLA